MKKLLSIVKSSFSSKSPKIFFKSKAQRQKSFENILFSKKNSEQQVAKDKVFNQTSNDTKKEKIIQTVKQVQYLQPSINWFQIKERKIDAGNFQLYETLLRAQMMKDDQQIEKVIVKLQKSEKKNENWMNICEAILYDQIEGKYSQGSAKKIQMVKLILEVGVKNNKINKYSAWVQLLIQNFLLNANQPEVKACSSHFQQLIICLLQKKPDIIGENFYNSETIFKFASFFLYSYQQKLNTLINILSQANTTKLFQFTNSINQSLMKYKINTNKSAFLIDKVLLDRYTQAFKQKNIKEVFICLIISGHCSYTILAQHFINYRALAFPTVDNILSQKICNDIFINNISRNNLIKVLQIAKSQKNNVSKIKALISYGNLQKAYKIFEKRIYKQIIIERWKRNTEYVLRRFKIQNLADSTFGTTINKEARSFVEMSIPKKWFWDIYKEDEQFLIQYKDKLPKDPHSFWEAIVKKQRAQKTYKWENSGLLQSFHQQTPTSPKTFNFQTYLKEQYPLAKIQLENRYQTQKEMIKYCLRVDSIIQEQYTVPNATLDKKLRECQNHLGPQNLALIQSCGLKDPSSLGNGWDDFKNKYIRFRRNNLTNKQQGIEPSFKINTSRILLSHFPLINQKILSLQFLEKLRLRNKDLWQEAKKCVKISPSPYVKQFILWGLYKRDPMSIYLGQKIAMATGQMIPHELAIKVSDMFSYRRHIDQNFVQKCKIALSFVGRINREHIYDLNKDYHHISHWKQFSQYAKYLEDFKTDQPRLNHIQMNIPCWIDRQIEPQYFIQSAMKGPL